MKFRDSGTQIDLSIDNLYVAGWTGRNKEAVDHHIQELADIGIAPPSTVPLYYRVSNNLLTQKPQVQVLGNHTSGEVEPILIQQGNTLWIGLASDHTDRELEAYSVAASKQACAKPVANEIWRFDSVADHIDSLTLRCDIEEDGQWIAYQDGLLANILPLPELISGAGLTDKSAMLCGTLPASGGVRPAGKYRMEIFDAMLNRKIQLAYTVETLPVVA